MQWSYREELAIALFLNSIKSFVSSWIWGAILSEVTIPSLVEAFNAAKPSASNSITLLLKDLKLAREVVLVNITVGLAAVKAEGTGEVASLTRLVSIVAKSDIVLTSVDKSLTNFLCIQWLKWWPLLSWIIDLGYLATCQASPPINLLSISVITETLFYSINLFPSPLHLWGFADGGEDWFLGIRLDGGSMSLFFILLLPIYLSFFH